jgi:ABC-2 type transport system ATP-binding protein
MRRRVAVAQALLGSPELVLLDEPTSGLDPHLVVRMREILAAERGRRTLVVSSHVLADLEAVCDHVVFIEAGRVVRAGPLAEVTRRSELVRIVLDGVPPLEDARAALHGLTLEADGSALVVAVPDGEDVASVNARVVGWLLARGARLLSIERGRSLEAAYMQERR